VNIFIYITLIHSVYITVAIKLTGKLFQFIERLLSTHVLYETRNKFRFQMIACRLCIPFGTGVHLLVVCMHVWAGIMQSVD
jgi:hypothetical protein